MIDSERIIPEELLTASRCLIRQNEVEKLMRTMTEEIELKLGELDLIVLTIMNGGLVPTGIFMKYFQAACQLDYIHVTRYGTETKGGKINWQRRPPNILQNRNVLLIDDILDQGVTLEAAVNECYKQGAKSVYTAVMVKKEVLYRSGIQKSDFYAIELPDEYLFGSGLDYKGYFRNLDGIYSLAETQELCNP